MSSGGVIRDELPTQVMSTRDELDDDYVAKLLAEDAEKTSQKYSNGVSALFSKRRGADAPKPNTRFLSHIVREADHHNATLKRKEVQEAQRRLRALRAHDEPPRKRRRADESDDGKKKRMLKDILAAAGVDRIQSRSRDARQQRPVAETYDRREREIRREQRGREHHEARKTRRRRRNSSSSSDSDSDSVEKRHQKHKRDNSGDSGQRSRRKSREGEHDKSKPGESCPVTDNDLTTGHKRGRGALSQRTDINDRFANDYDPSQDVWLDSHEDADDWDLALEAMRDRAKYRKNQAGRMREAGFEEREIAKFEQSVLKHKLDGDARDVQWSKKGEPREWDAGKIEQE